MSLVAPDCRIDKEGWVLNFNNEAATQLPTKTLFGAKLSY